MFITNNITTAYDQQNASASFQTNFSMALRLLLTNLQVLVYVLFPTNLSEWLRFSLLQSHLSMIWSMDERYTAVQVPLKTVT